MTDDFYTVEVFVFVNLFIVKAKMIQHLSQGNKSYTNGSMKANGFMALENFHLTQKSPGPRMCFWHYEMFPCCNLNTFQFNS